jgi:hypothetical protein
MSGRVYKRLAREWGYFTSVFLALLLTLLPFAVGSPGPVERALSSRERPPVRSCYTLRESPRELRCAAPAEEVPPFVGSSGSAASHPRSHDGDAMDLFFRGLRDALGGA